MSLGGWDDAEVSVSPLPTAGTGEAVAVSAHPFSAIAARCRRVSSTTQP